MSKCGCSYYVDGETVNITVNGELPDHADLRMVDGLTLSGRGTILGNDVKLPKKIRVDSYEDRSNEIKSPYGDGEKFNTDHLSHITIFPKGKLNGVEEVQLYNALGVYFPKGAEVSDGMKLTGILEDHRVNYLSHLNATQMEISGYVPEGIDLSNFEKIELHNVKSIGRDVKFPKEVLVYGSVPQEADLSGIEKLKFFNEILTREQHGLKDNSELNPLNQSKLAKVRNKVAKVADKITEATGTDKLVQKHFTGGKKIADYDIGAERKELENKISDFFLGRSK